MPYITDDRKEQIQIPHVLNVGELTYVIDRMAEELVWQQADYDFRDMKYEMLAGVRGAIANAADEFYRRVIAPYEDRKIVQNGDVFMYPYANLEPEQVVDTMDATLVSASDLTVTDHPRVGRLTIVPSETEAS